MAKKSKHTKIVSGHKGHMKKGKKKGGKKRGGKKRGGKR